MDCPDPNLSPKGPEFKRNFKINEIARLSLREKYLTYLPCKLLMCKLICNRALPSTAAPDAMEYI